jgi:hypothetical protein
MLNLAEDGGLENPIVAKALVMAALARMIDEGGAVIATLESGTLELRLATGEIFHLGEGDSHAYCLTFPAAVRTKLSTTTLNGVRGSRRSDGQRLLSLC